MTHQLDIFMSGEKLGLKAFKLLLGAISFHQICVDVLQAPVWQVPYVAIKPFLMLLGLCAVGRSCTPLLR